MTPPVVTINEKPAFVSTDTTPTFTFSSDDPAFSLPADDPNAGVFQCSLDGSPFTVCESPKTYTAAQLALASGSVAGTHTFEVQGSVHNLLAEPLPVTYEWTIEDHTAPETTIVTGPTPPRIALETPATFTFSSNELDAEFECALDPGPVGPRMEQLRRPAGQHRRVRQPAARRPHPARAGGRPEPEQRLHPRVLQLHSRRAAGDDDHLRSGRRLCHHRDQRDLHLRRRPACGRGELRLLARRRPARALHLAEELHARRSSRPRPATRRRSATTPSRSRRPTTSSSMVEDPPASRSWMIDDGVAPDTTIEAGPPATTMNSTATFTFSSNELEVDFECSLDGGATWTGCGSPHELADLALGDYTLQVRAVDPAGNVDGSPASHSFSVVAPQQPNTPVGTDVTVQVPMPPSTGGNGDRDLHRGLRRRLHQRHEVPRRTRCPTVTWPPARLLRRQHDGRVQRAGHRLPAARRRRRACPDPPQRGRRLDRRHGLG